MSIDSKQALQAGTPLYKVIKAQLQESIQRGEWRPGEAIPAEKRLSERYNISIGTLRKAVDELTEEKTLIRHQGRGTFVALQEARDFTYAFKRLIPSTNDAALSLSKESHDVAVKALLKASAHQEEAEDLNLHPGAEVYRIRLQHLLENTPVALEQITVPAERFPNLDERLVERYRGNLYQLYQDTYATTVLKVRDMVGSQIVDEGITHLLDCAHNQPMVHVKRVAWSYHDDPVESRHSWIDPRKAKFVVTSTD
jgi:GntR family transcriptional regulator